MVPYLLSFATKGAGSIMDLYPELASSNAHRSDLRQQMLTQSGDKVQLFSNKQK